MTKVALDCRSPIVIASALMIAAAALTYTTAPSTGLAGEPRGPAHLVAKPKAPPPIKEVFVRAKPHTNVGAQQNLSKLKARPGKPKGPGSLAGDIPELADWYCGEGSGPGGHASCTKDLIASCNGTYVPPKTNGDHQTWGMCHEQS